MDKDFQAIVRNAQNLMKAGAICGGVSLIIGGVLLGTIGLVLVIVGWNRFSKAYNATPINPSLQQQMNTMFKISLTVCVIALALNAMTLVMMWPVIEQVLASGDVSLMYGTVGSGAGSAAVTGGSTWG